MNKYKFYDTSSLLKLTEEELEGEFIISSITLSELENIPSINTDVPLEQLLFSLIVPFVAVEIILCPVHKTLVVKSFPAYLDEKLDIKTDRFVCVTLQKVHNVSIFELETVPLHLSIAEL